MNKFREDKYLWPVSAGMAVLCLVTLLAVQACSTTTATTATNVAATTVAGAEVALTAADQVAITYVTQKPCPVGGPVAWTCSDPTTVTKIKSLSLTAYNYVKQAESGVATVQTAMAAINALIGAVPATPAQ